MIFIGFTVLILGIILAKPLVWKIGLGIILADIIFSACVILWFSSCWG